MREVGGSLVWAMAALVAALQVSVLPAAVAGALGAVAGFLAGKPLAASRLRLPAVWGGGLFLGAVVGWLSRMPVRLAWVGGLLGPEGAYSLAEAASWFLLALVAVAVLRCTTHRFPPALGGEVAVVAAALASPFAAHRDGFISRPHFLVDPLWSRGYDPVPVLLAMGAATAGLLVVLALGRFTRRATLLDVLLLLGLVGLLFLTLPVQQIKELAPEPQITGMTQGEGGEGTPGRPGDGQGRGEGRNQSDMDLRDRYRQGQPRPVAVVLLHDDYEPVDGFFYFRQSALSMFNGRRLVRDTSGRVDLDVARWFPSPGLALELPPQEESLSRKVTTTVALVVHHSRPFGLLQPFAMSARPNPDPDRFVRAYSVESMVPTYGLADLVGRRAGDPRWTRAIWEHYTRLPDDDRYRDLAARIVSEKLPERLRTDPVAQAAAIKIWLEENGTYSLESRHQHAADPVAHFLFGDKVGYCTHFAHATAYLLRALGIPARVATGYAYDARFRGGGSALVLMDNYSHAWAELYLERVGWVVLDIAPVNSRVPEAPPPDPDLQRMLGQMARQEVPPEKDHLQEKQSLVERMRRRVRQLLRLLYMALLLGVVGLYGVKVYRRVSVYTGSPEQAVHRAFRAALDRLAEAGRVRRYGQTRESFAREHRAASRALEDLTELHLRVSLGTHPPPPREEVLKLYRHFQRELTERLPLWRRLLGALDPFSWLRVR